LGKPHITRIKSRATRHHMRYAKRNAWRFFLCILRYTISMSFSKIRVAVLRGGPSSEYDVSLKSGHTVLKNLPSKYHPIDIFISKDGLWHRGGLEKKPHDALHDVDVIFNALHGEYGEDGKVQQLLDESTIPYTGSGAAQSALSMNKILTKETLAKHFTLKTPRHFAVRKGEDVQSKAHDIFKIMHAPYIVKPISLGSSVGVSLVKSIHGLPDVLELALQNAALVMVEEYIHGKEVTCGVVDDLRGSRHYTLPLVEIIPPQGSPFFDYDAKYGGQSQEICPGRFSESEKKEIEALARDVHATLGLRHYSRSDFIVHREKGIYFLEVNTLPGLTSESLLPKALEAVGVTLPSFFDHVLTLALKKN
jgi:D-alanine-D-alanine ligase